MQLNIDTIISKKPVFWQAIKKYCLLNLYVSYWNLVSYTISIINGKVQVHLRNNYVHNEEQCIFASDSHNNEIYSNNVESCGNGIYLRSESSNNNIHNNIIKDTENGFQVNSGASDNWIHSNTIINATELGISNGEDAGDGNTFTDNTLINATLISLDEGEA